PLGYSTLARPAGDEAARGLWPLNCGIVGREQRRLIATLGIRYVTLHRGLFRGASHADLLVAARAGLRGAGFRRIAHGGEVELWRLDGRAKTSPRPRTQACRAWAEKAL
ncbi:MAG: hypothetical protein QOE29_467, partial [Gaiellaceae bacterium]|nr:hypothetical protein [Gaiellaceae bacterium]